MTDTVDLAGVPSGCMPSVQTPAEATSTAVGSFCVRVLHTSSLRLGVDRDSVHRPAGIPSSGTPAACTVVDGILILSNLYYCFLP